MSIQSEVSRIDGAKGALKTAIEGKGVAVPEGTRIEGYAALVESISTGVDTSDATAAATDMASGKTAYVNGSKVTGNVPVTNSDASVSIGTGTASKYSSYLRLTGTMSTNRLLRKSAKPYLQTSLSNLGNAAATDVAAGKTFTSSAGVQVTGTASGIGGVDLTDVAVSVYNNTFSTSEDVYIYCRKTDGSTVYQVIGKYETLELANVDMTNGFHAEDYYETYLPIDIAYSTTESKFVVEIR